MNIKFVSLFLLTLACTTNAAPAASDWTELHHAAYYGQYEMLQAIFATADSFNRQCKINLKCKSCQGCTPLHLAAMQGRVQCVQLLLNNEADINAQNDNDNTPLHLAAYSGQLACVQKLVLRGASFTIHNNDEKTPAMLAAEQGHNEIVAYFDKYLKVHAEQALDEKFFAELDAEQEYQEILIAFGNITIE